MESAEPSVRQIVRSRRCNLHTCLAYSLSVLASIVIVEGFYLCFKHRDRVWLSLPCLGVALILVGSCLYRCGVRKLYTTNYGVAKRNRASKGATFFESQLSLNMLPQCFSNTSSARILNSSGHRYLILPAESQPSHSSEIQMQNLTLTSANEANKSNANMLTEDGTSSSSEVENTDQTHHSPVSCDQSVTPPSDSFSPIMQIRPQLESDTEAQTGASLDIAQNVLVGAPSRESLSLVEHEVIPHSNSLIQFGLCDDEPIVNSDGSPVNEAPPSYDSIDFDTSSEILTGNYRTL